MSRIVQYGKQANQPVQLININTFYRSGKGSEITFVFTNEHTQVWKFSGVTECDAVFKSLITGKQSL